jgi:Family of unknown function (DUF6370)
MRTAFASVFVVVAAVLLLSGVQAGEKTAKEVTLKGTITCAKCDLGKEKKCMTVIVAKDKNKKDVIYYLDAKSGKANHGKICNDPTPGTVTGVVTTDGDKKTITATKVTFDEK